MALVLAFFYYPLGTNQASVQNRIGLIINVKTSVYLSLFRSLSRYSTDKKIFLREYADDAASVVSFLLTYTIDSISFLTISSSELLPYKALTGLP